MRRFLLSLFFVGALSAVFSFTAFAATDYVDSPYMGSGQATFNHTVSYSVSANDGDFFYFDVNVSKGYDTILNPSGTNIASQVYNEYFDYSYSVQALGTNYGFGTVQTEGNRVWVFADRPVSSITVTYQVTISYSWRSGTFNGSPTQDLTQCIARCPFTVTTGNISKSGTNWPTDIVINDKLDSILEQLGDTSVIAPDFLGPDAIVYFRKDYFADVRVDSGSVYYDSRGMAVVNIEENGILTFADYTVTYSLSPGDYYIVIAAIGYPAQYPSLSSIFGYDSSYYEVVDVSNKQLYGGGTCASFIRVRVKKPIVTTDIAFTFSSSMTNITVYGGIIPVDDDVIFGDSVNPDQDGMVSDVDDAGEQQSQQEDQMWQNINTYKGDISFNLDGWDDAAGGLSYVTGVFMTIWNNSPTQPIVLSLMLGIAMLSIGRGVMAAVRVSRNRGDD